MNFLREFRTEIKLVLVVALAAVVLAVAGILLLQMQSGTPASENEGWQSYRNTTYGFEFMYPARYRRFPTSDPAELTPTPFNADVFSVHITIDRSSNFRIKIYKNKSLQDLLLSYKDAAAQEGTSVSSEKDIYVDGASGVEFVVEGGESVKLKYILWAKDGLVYEFIYGVAEHHENREILEGIFSTFKFIPGSPVSEGQDDSSVSPEPSPQPESDRFAETTIKSTEVIFYQATKLPDSTIYKGSCYIGSGAALGRVDAWRCFIESRPLPPNTGNLVDPCFESAKDGYLVCVPRPTEGFEGVVLELTKPLPSGGFLGPGSIPSSSPWLVELEDGQVCGIMSGTAPVVDGKRVNYSCGLFGEFQKGEVWKTEQVSLQQENGQWTIKSKELVSIRRVWQ